MSRSTIRFVHTLSAGSALALALPALSPALAAPTDARSGDAPAAPAEAGTDDGNAITVTAQHRTEKLQDVPTAITVLDKDLFAVGGLGRSANEVLTQVPNASAGTQQHGRPRWWIRGVGAGQQQLDLANPVGFYLDDVYISNASATGIPLFDIDQVEVLRGPQGTLWGKNTTGGAINIKSKRPQLSPDRQDNYAKLEYGSYDDKIAEAAIGTAIIADRLAARVSFRVDDRNGRFNNLYTGQKSNAINDTVVRAQILAKPVEDVEVLLSGHYRRYTTQGGYWTTASYASTGLYRNGYAPSPNPNDISLNAGEWSDNNQSGGKLHIDWKLGGVTLTAITGYERFTTRGPNDSDYTPLEISRGYTQAGSRQWTQELRLTSPQSGPLTWIGGLFYFNETIASDTYSATLPAGAVPAQAGSTAAAAYSLTHFNHKAESGAVFGSATYAFSNAFKLTAGGRWSRETKTLDFARYAAPNAAAASWSNYSQWWNSYTGTYGGPGTFSGNLRNTWDAFTWDVTPNFHIDRNNLLYVKASYGLKSGGFNTAATLPVALVAVRPEKLYAYEAGYKSTWLDGKLSFNATAFHYDYRDVQVNVVGPNPGAVGGATVSYLQNANRARVNGAEFELALRPIEGLKLNAALGLLDTKYKDFQVLNGGANLSGNQFVRSPHTTLNVSGSYTVPISGGSKVEVAADARYTSLQYFYVTPQDTVNRALLTQGGYTLANARITYTTRDERISASVFVNNLFDVTYRNHALPAASGTAVTGDIVQYGDPRTWGASLLYRF